MTDKNSTKKNLVVVQRVWRSLRKTPRLSENVEDGNKSPLFQFQMLGIDTHEKQHNIYSKYGNNGSKRRFKSQLQVFLFLHREVEADG